MSSAKIAVPVRTRPGGRTAAVTRRLFEAVMELLVEGGFEAVTFQAVAERAQVGRATLYRRWPNPAALVAEAIRATAALRITIPDSGSLRSDLNIILNDIARFLSDPVGKAALVAGLTLSRNIADEARAVASWANRWSEVSPVFAKAMSRGEFDEGGDPEAMFAAIAGTLYFRLLVMNLPVDPPWIEQVLDQFFGKTMAMKLTV